MTVRAHFVMAGDDTGGHLRCALERDGRRRESGGHAVLRQQSEHARRAFVDAVGVVALVAVVAHGLLEHHAELVDRLWPAIAVDEVLFGTLFDVHHQRQRESCIAGPAPAHQ
jgi:hypothetical protein